MRCKVRTALMTGLLSIVVSLAMDSTQGYGFTLQQQAGLVVSNNQELSKSAIVALRAAGPAGLDALVQAYQTEIDAHLTPAASSTEEAANHWSRVKTALDTVAGQYDAYTSRLYWYTDFDAARAAAKKSGKPILSLRLLGKLTDEYSCANSRFFRTTLYANDEVSRVLRDHFVLHWQSVRPVPVVTIDFGDGRKLARTLTGNSIHYILDSNGRPIDALPGLYGPQAFLRGLKVAETAASASRSMDEGERAIYLRQYHQSSVNQIVSLWRNDLKQLNMLKSDGEQLSDGADSSAAANTLLSVTDDAVWGRIAELHTADAQLDAASRALIAAQNPAAERAMPLAATKAVVENPILRLVRSFQNSMAIDSVRNEYTFHRRIHEWFATGQTPIDIDVNQLNDRIYAQLFLTPNGDPWLGLLPGDGYTALDNNGICQK